MPGGVVIYGVMCLDSELTVRADWSGYRGLHCFMRPVSPSLYFSLDLPNIYPSIYLSIYIFCLHVVCTFSSNMSLSSNVACFAASSLTEHTLKHTCTVQAASSTVYSVFSSVIAFFHHHHHRPSPCFTLGPITFSSRIWCWVSPAKRATCWGAVAHWFIYICVISHAKQQSWLAPLCLFIHCSSRMPESPCSP